MLTASDTAFSIAAVRADEGSRPSHERLFEDSYAILFRALGTHAEAGTRRYLELPSSAMESGFGRDSSTTPCETRSTTATSRSCCSALGSIRDLIAFRK
jgi:hypothetical protein